MSLTLTWPSSPSVLHRPRSRSRLGAGVLAMSSLGLLTVGRNSSGCTTFECEHDWQCGASEICIPYQGLNQCENAPVCTSSADCPGEKGCIVRSRRLVNTGPRDPFTSSEPGKRTCGGDEGPADVPDMTDGCVSYSPSGVGGSTGTFGSGGGGTSAYSSTHVSGVTVSTGTFASVSASSTTTGATSTATSSNSASSASGSTSASSTSQASAATGGGG